MAEADDADVEAMIEEVVVQLKKDFPLEKYVETFGPLHWDGWVRRLHRDPAGQAELKTLIDEAEEHTAYGVGKVLQRLMACIKRIPDLDRRVKDEYRIQMAHLLRQVLFAKSLNDPKAKPKEWRRLLDRIEVILERHAKKAGIGGDDYYLVDDQVEEPGHKIELSDPDLLTPKLIEDLQSALKGLKNDWYVILQLDFDVVNPDVDPGMLVVWATQVDEFLDKERMRAVLGPRFKL